MVQRRCSSITHPLPLSYNVPKDTALRVISNHLEYLLDKKQLIDKMVEMKGKCTYLDMDEREVLRSRPSVKNQIDVLNKVKDEISSTDNCPLSVVAEQLQELHQNRALISEAEEYLCLGISLIMSQYEVICSKSEVVHQINVLEKIFMEMSLGQLPLTGGHRGREVVEYQLPPLLMRVREFRVFADISEHGESTAESAGESPGESSRRCEAVRNLKFSPSMNENERREVINGVKSEPLNKRYLFVTSGFEIFCLDLKECKDQTFSNAHDVPFIPRIATIDLLEGNLPTSAGLFKWKSNAYMIGGAIEEKPKGKSRCAPYNHDMCTHTVKGTSCLTYGLSLADDGTLSHSESNNIWKLKKPKLWPIVEEINGQIHVIDSAPPRCAELCYGWLFSHEVFNPDTAIWAEEIIPKLSEDRYCMNSYSVLGDRIFAVSDRAFLVFDSNNKKWEAHSKHQWLKDPHSLKEVWHILEHGPGRCVGRFPFPYGGEPSDDPLYVLIALERDIRNHFQGTHPVAHLVTSTGQILCSQRLVYFFKGPVWPCYMFDGTIIRVDDDDDDEEEKTFCSIVNGHAWDNSYGGNYLFINTFHVEMLADAAAMIRELVAKGSEAWPGIIEQEFVRVDAKDSYIYKTDAELGWRSHSSYWSGVRACFL